MVSSEMHGRKTDSLNVYLLPDSFTCRHEIKAVRYIVRTVTTRDWNKLFTRFIEHHNEAFRRGGFFAVNPSPHSWILTFVSEDTSPRVYTSATIRIPVHTAAPKCVSEPIRIYMTLHFCDRWGVTPSVTEKVSNLPFLCVNRSPIYPPGYGVRVGVIEKRSRYVTLSWYKIFGWQQTVKPHLKSEFAPLQTSSILFDLI